MTDLAALVAIDWLRRGLRYAPLAALAAVVVPEVLMSQDQLLTTWRDARPYAVAAGTAWFFWRRTLLGTILSGMAVLVPLKLLFGW
jgi:branched-subunit amino acid transport protein